MDKNPEATAMEFTSDGWFKTGDVAAVDAPGIDGANVLPPSRHSH